MMGTGGRGKLLRALEQAARQRGARHTGDIERVCNLVADADEAVRSAACRLAALWDVEAVRPRLADSDIAMDSFANTAATGACR